MSKRERWLPIAEWEELYEVSSLGRVRSLDRYVTHRIKQAMATRCCRGKVLKACLRSGYPFVMLAAGPRRKSLLMHRLVATAFVPNEKCHPIVLHKDGSRTNCNADNLMWGTHAENSADMFRHGTASLGVKRPLAKLNDTSVRAIRRAYASGVEIAALARTYTVHRKTLLQVVRNETWRHVCG